MPTYKNTGNKTVHLGGGKFAAPGDTFTVKAELKNPHLTLIPKKKRTKK